MKKISGMVPADALNGQEKIEVVQNGVTRQSNIDAIATFIDVSSHLASSSVHFLESDINIGDIGVSAHKHPSQDITDYESIDDRVRELLIPGVNVSFLYDDGENTLTVNATAPSGGVSQLYVDSHISSVSGASKEADNRVKDFALSLKSPSGNILNRSYEYIDWNIHNLTLPTSASDNDVTYAIHNLTLPLSASYQSILSLSAASKEEDNRIWEQIALIEAESASAASREQDNRIREEIISASAASREQDNRIREEIISVSAASRESDNKVKEELILNLNILQHDINTFTSPNSASQDDVKDVDGQLLSHLVSTSVHYLESEINFHNIGISAHGHPVKYSDINHSHPAGDINLDRISDGDNIIRTRDADNVVMVSAGGQKVTEFKNAEILFGSTKWNNKIRINNSGNTISISGGNINFYGNVPELNGIRYDLNTFTSPNSASQNDLRYEINNLTLPTSASQNDLNDIRYDLNTFTSPNSASQNDLNDIRYDLNTFTSPNSASQSDLNDIRYDLNTFTSPNSASQDDLSYEIHNLTLSTSASYESVLAVSAASKESDNRLLSKLQTHLASSSVHFLESEIDIGNIGASAHKHPSQDITDFESIDDRINNFLQEGSNVTLVYDDINNTLTINAGSPTAGASVEYVDSQILSVSGASKEADNRIYETIDIVQNSINTFTSPNSASQNDLTYEIHNLTLPTSASQNDLTYEIHNLTLPTSASQNDLTYEIHNLTLPLSASYENILSVSAASKESDNRLQEQIDSLPSTDAVSAASKESDNRLTENLTEHTDLHNKIYSSNNVVRTRDTDNVVMVSAGGQTAAHYFTDGVRFKSSGTQSLQVTAGGIVVSDGDRQYQIKVNGQDLELGDNLLTFSVSANAWVFKNPLLWIGTNDTQYGTIRLFGHLTGSEGGQIYLYTSGQYDSVIDYFSIKSNQDDLIIGPSNNPNSLSFLGGSNSWQFENSVMFGIDDDTSGILYVYGAASNAGGLIYIYNAGNQDSSINNYQIQSSLGELLIGPNTNTDALKYNATSNRWNFTAPVDFLNTSNISAASQEEDNRLWEKLDIVQHDINTFTSPNSASQDDLRYEINNLTLPTSASQNDLRYEINNLTLPTSANQFDILSVSAASHEQDQRFQEQIDILESKAVSSSIELDNPPSSDLTGSGEKIKSTIDSNSYGVACCLVLTSGGSWVEADATQEETVGQLSMALEAGTGANKWILLQGIIRNDTWNWTPNSQLYVSRTAGEITNNRPTSAGEFGQVIGYALTPDTIRFNPSPDYYEGEVVTI